MGRKTVGVALTVGMFVGGCGQATQPQVLPPVQDGPVNAAISTLGPKISFTTELSSGNLTYLSSGTFTTATCEEKGTGVGAEQTSPATWVVDKNAGAGRVGVPQEVYLALRAADNPTTAGGLCQLVKNLPNVVTTTDIMGQKGGSEPKIVADWDIPKIQNFRKTNLDNATPGHTAGSGREAEMNVDEFFNTYGPVTFILSDGSKLERITVPQRSAPDTPVYTVTFTPTKRIPPSIP